MSIDKNKIALIGYEANGVNALTIRRLVQLIIDQPIKQKAYCIGNNKSGENQLIVFIPHLNPLVTTVFKAIIKTFLIEHKVKEFIGDSILIDLESNLCRVFDVMKSQNFEMMATEQEDLFTVLFLRHQACCDDIAKAMNSIGIPCTFDGVNYPIKSTQ